MPIRPELRKFYYGPHWEAVRQQILARAGNCCERCAAPNGAVGRRYKDGRFIACLGGLLVGEVGHIRLIRIRLGPAHLNHLAGDDRPENLLGLCQYCHLWLDRHHHKQTRSVRRDKNRPLLNFDQ